ncbi:hypothetical protein ACH5RR_039846 [Cinchona calisaya]|uniref:Uncharacterized protein n=1 Tax=Cinchona calisaya TaxID=153742 RepID=A0ABD2Y0Q4_9GENT
MKMPIYEPYWLKSVLKEIRSLRSRFRDELWDQVLVVVKELDHLETFALCTAVLETKQVVSGETGPIDVCYHFEDALRKATSEIRRAPKQSIGTGKESKMDNECLSQAVSKLRDTMEVFRPKIVEAYAHLSTTPFAPERDHMINRDFLLLPDLIQYTCVDLNNLVDQYKEEKGRDQFQLPESVWLSVKALARINNALFMFLRDISWTSIEHCIRTNPKCIAFLSHFASVFVRAAYFSYSWSWMRTDGNGQVDHQKGKEEIVDLLKQVMPKSPRVIDLCFHFLRACKFFGNNKSLQTENVTYRFVHFLIPNDVDRNELVMTTFRKGLAWLIIFLTDEPDLYDDDMKMLLTEVTALACELGGRDDSLRKDLAKVVSGGKEHISSGQIEIVLSQSATASREDLLGINLTLIPLVSTNSRIPPAYLEQVEKPSISMGMINLWRKDNALSFTMDMFPKEMKRNVEETQVNLLRSLKARSSDPNQLNSVEIFKTQAPLSLRSPTVDILERVLSLALLSQSLQEGQNMSLVASKSRGGWKQDDDQCVVLLLALRDELDKVNRRFLWAGTDSNRKMSMISWDNVVCPK